MDRGDSHHRWVRTLSRGGTPVSEYNQPHGCRVLMVKGWFVCFFKFT